MPKKKAEPLVFNRDYDGWACFDNKTNVVFAFRASEEPPMWKPRKPIGSWVRVKFQKVE